MLHINIIARTNGVGFLIKTSIKTSTPLSRHCYGIRDFSFKCPTPELDHQKLQVWEIATKIATIRSSEAVAVDLRMRGNQESDGDQNRTIDCRNHGNSTRPRILSSHSSLELVD